MWSQISPLTKRATQPSKERPDRTTNSQDITQDIKPNQLNIKREVNPLNPDYSLPKYETIPPPEVPQKYNPQRLDDIEGAQGRSQLVSKNLHKMPEERDLLNVKDINQNIKIAEHIHDRDEKYNNLSILVDQKKPQPVRKDFDTMNPSYDWKDAQKMELKQEKEKDYKAHNAQLTTQDIAGLQDERERKNRFKYGNCEEVRDLTYCDDITRAYMREKFPRFDQFTEQQSQHGADMLGQEKFERPKIVGTVAVQTFDNPFKDANKKPMEKPAYLTKNENVKKADEKPLTLPPDEEVHRDFSQKFAGLNSGMLKYAVKHQTVGQLPGPTDYKDKPQGFCRTSGYQLGSWHDTSVNDRFFKKIEIGRDADAYSRSKVMTESKSRSPEAKSLRLCSVSKDQRERQQMLLKQEAHAAEKQEKVDRVKEERIKLIKKEIQEVENLPW